MSKVSEYSTTPTYLHFLRFFLLSFDTQVRSACADVQTMRHLIHAIKIVAV